MGRIEHCVRGKRLRLTSMLVLSTELIAFALRRTQFYLVKFAAKRLNMHKARPAILETMVNDSNKERTRTTLMTD